MTPSLAPFSVLVAFAVATAPAQDAADGVPAGRQATPGNMMSDSPVRFPERGALPSEFPPDLQTESYDAGEDGYYLFSSPARSLAQVREIQAAMPDGRFSVPPNDWRHLRRTRRLLTAGGSLHIMAIGDSIVSDTMRSGWVSLLREDYPRAAITATVYVRGSGGCQHFVEEDRMAKHVIPRKPDLVFIGGISQTGTNDIGRVIDEIRSALPDCEILLGTGAFGTTDPRHAGKLAAARHSGTGEYGHALRKLAEEKRCAYLDLTGPWAEYLNSSREHPHRFYRDAVHANPFGEQVLAKILRAFWTAPAPQ